MILNGIGTKKMPPEESETVKLPDGTIVLASEYAKLLSMKLLSDPSYLPEWLRIKQ